jgi:hypothetical protein
VSKLEPQGGANLRTDEDTGKPFWSLWGEGWKDGQDMDPGECVVLNPDTFPAGSRVVIYEPGPDTKASREFYAKFGTTPAERPADSPRGPVVEATRQQWELMTLRLLRRLPRDDPHRKQAERFLLVHGDGPLAALRDDPAGG